MVFWKTLTFTAAALCASAPAGAGAACRWRPCPPAVYSDAWCEPGWGAVYRPAYERRAWARPYVPTAAYSYEEREETLTPSVHERDYLHYN